MTELERIENNIQGELPEDNVYEIIKIKGVQNPEDELNTFKSFIKTFLENKHLDRKDLKWNELLPQKVIKFTEQLKEEDYFDELVSHISLMINDLKRVREWEWYSSKLTDDGFEVVVNGIFRGVFLPIIHHQGIPHKSIFFYTPERGEFSLNKDNNGKDVLSYRTWNPETYELK